MCTETVSDLEGQDFFISLSHQAWSGILNSIERNGVSDIRYNVNNITAGMYLIVVVLFGTALVAEASVPADFDKLLFVKRYTYQSSHYYTDFIDGCENFGGNICILSVKDGTITELVPSMRHGIFGRYDLSFDGKRVVFDWKEKIGKGFRIFEVGIDGKGLRQLTFEPPDE